MNSGALDADSCKNNPHASPIRISAKQHRPKMMKNERLLYFVSCMTLSFVFMILLARYVHFAPMYIFCE
jgi:hypothetical protein